VADNASTVKKHPSPAAAENRRHSPAIVAIAPQDFLLTLFSDNRSSWSDQQAQRVHMHRVSSKESSLRRRSGIRWGLCCLFQEEPIHFGVRQATHLAKFDRTRQLALLSATVLANGHALQAALAYCGRNGIGAFRVNSRIFPLKTHPQVGYRLEDLPDHVAIEQVYRHAGHTAAHRDIRLSFHPDQFTLLSSPDAGVTARSLAELTYQAEVAALIGADVITLHGGGAYGDKRTALHRVAARLERLPDPIRSRLALENDDRVYTPADLLPVCAATSTPFVYDVHHHRCLADGRIVEEVTERALATWSREPLFHLSSPKDGWQSTNPRPHHDFIDPADMPPCWRPLPITVEVEAKAKEVALRRLRTDLALGPALPGSSE
jgi:UV DNA damage endonuclease